MFAPPQLTAAKTMSRLVHPPPTISASCALETRMSLATVMCETSQPTARYRFAYVLLNPFRWFVTVNDPSSLAEILIQ